MIEGKRRRKTGQMDCLRGQRPPPRLRRAFRGVVQGCGSGEVGRRPRVRGLSSLTIEDEHKKGRAMRPPTGARILLPRASSNGTGRRHIGTALARIMRHRDCTIPPVSRQLPPDPPAPDQADVRSGAARPPGMLPARARRTGPPFRPVEVRRVGDDGLPPLQTTHPSDLVTSEPTSTPGHGRRVECTGGWHPDVSTLDVWEAVGRPRRCHVSDRRPPRRRPSPDGALETEADVSDVGPSRSGAPVTAIKGGGVSRSPKKAPRRRPSGAPPPLPRHLRTTGAGWLIGAVVAVVATVWSSATVSGARRSPSSSSTTPSCGG